MKSRSFGIAIMLAILLTTGVNPAVSAAAPKAGQKCSKAGVTQVSTGKKFTCVKTGSKLIWNKGVVVQKTISPKPIRNPSITLVPAKKAEQGLGCAFEGQEAFSLGGPLVCMADRWLLVQVENDSVQSRAYRFVLDRWNQQPEGSLTIDFYIDQSAGPWVNEIEGGLKAGARFWGTSSAGSKPIPAFISNNPTFIEEAIAKAGIKQSVEARDRNRNARGGQAGFHGGQNSYWDFLFRTPESRTTVGYFQVAPHEYSHYAQSQLGAGGNWTDAGPWFNEGLASFIGSALGPMVNMPHDQMNEWRGNLNPNSTTSIAFFNENSQSVYQSSQWGEVYALGALATQALVALVGMDAVLSFYKDIGTSSNKESAYKRNFKLESSQLVAVLQGYIDSIRNKKEWSLAILDARYKGAIGQS